MLGFLAPSMKISVIYNNEDYTNAQKCTKVKL